MSLGLILFFVSGLMLVLTSWVGGFTSKGRKSRWSKYKKLLTVLLSAGLVISMLGMFAGMAVVLFHNWIVALVLFFVAMPIFGMYIAE